ncbi:ABC transporter substrate-binding protein [Streptomyces acidiscabies]|uniref:ABC transporter substrate-binding protein n=1 Tax=Streptomyces acidiscabies TaxID=42234 RepID=A0AAP6BAZ9_9ACTN|nr:ABC transporter substrate-binding protein [Streptomyces acidiscabies]MBP5935020.1 ABC transporter substrate-binding protein [Streptomyces sp. LBUM 1476]MBZ3917198.1 ABC transporter substrate-binding protein [Streptomyces acidiscabies]MDX2961438.1 ABC transporter substrate-binding protein [Streptomyces acidiscabies]MDX3023226.1 ABC transporter substrate-binding protein [Streptomyces acidiscabies]MDX3792160.1 ABC transporter substrate-binding protein [Streptomyces acidiscabies]
MTAQLPLRAARSAALVTSALLLAACSSGADDAASGATVPRSGGTLTFAVGSDAGCVDPQQVGSNDTIYSVRQLVDSLTDQDPKTGKIVPWLAKSWEVSPDARQFTFRLRPGVTFSDGSALTAQVVKDNFDAVPKLGALGTLAQGYLSGVESTTAVDPLTVRVTFKNPNAQFLQATSTHSLGIESSASVKLTPQEKCSKGVVGSGPFTLTRYVQNQSITLARRAAYAWGSSLWTKQGEAYLDKLVFKVVPEAGVRAGSLQSGQVDAISSVGKANEAALQGGSVNLQRRANPGIVFGLSLNNARPVLKDVRVRQAIRTAIDRQQVATTVFPTGTQPATSVLAHTTPDYTDLGAGLAFDAAKAKSLLDAAGWKPGGDGIRTKDGAKLSLTVKWFANSATNQPALELIQQQLKEVGVGIVLQQLQISQLAQVQQSGDFDGLWGNITRADPDILRSSFSTKLANLYRLPATPLDTALTGQAAATDPARRKELVAQAQQLIVDNAYTVPVVELQTQLGVAKKVHGLAFDASSRIQLHDTWIG